MVARGKRKLKKICYETRLVRNKLRKVLGNGRGIGT